MVNVEDLRKETKRILKEGKVKYVIGYEKSQNGLMPKPVNRHQAYRFLGLGRLHWLDESQRIELLAHVLERYPPYFIPLMPIRFHEHPQLTSLAQAKQLVEQNVVPEEWRTMTGMLLEREEATRA